MRVADRSVKQRQKAAKRVEARFSMELSLD
jgi:hypothetical protein